VGRPAGIGLLHRKKCSLELLCGALIYCAAQHAKDASMAKPAPFTAPTGFKFPKLDLDTVFTTQKANLAVAHEA
jgi:hypothetical protein